VLPVLVLLDDVPVLDDDEAAAPTVAGAGAAGDVESPDPLVEPELELDELFLPLPVRESLR
jgi:hypothetical protein